MENALSQVFGTSGDPDARYDGKTDRQIVRELMSAAGFDDAEISARMHDTIAAYVAGLRERLQAPDRTVATYPGIVALIDALDQDDSSVLGLLTGNVEQGAQLKLEAAGLSFDRFVVNAFGSDHEVRSELPAIAHRRMCAEYGVSLAGRDMVVVGDTPSDIACGRSIGARAIGVATGHYGVDELSRHEPFAVFQDLSDTAAVMAAILA